MNICPRDVCMDIWLNSYQLDTWKTKEESLQVCTGENLNGNRLKYAHPELLCRTWSSKLPSPHTPGTFCKMWVAKAPRYYSVECLWSYSKVNNLEFRKALLRKYWRDNFFWARLPFPKKWIRSHPVEWKGGTRLELVAPIGGPPWVN